MTELKRLNPMSVAKLQGLLGVIGGLIVGILVAIFTSIAGSALQQAGGQGGSGLAFLGGVGAIVGMPIMYGVVGFIGGLIGAWLYNLVAKWVGGIEIELVQKGGPSGASV